MMIPGIVRAVIAASVAYWLVIPADADVPQPRPKPTCSDLTAAIDNARALSLRVRQMNAFQAGAFLDAFNRQPPQTNYDGDAVLVTSGDSPGFVGIHIFARGCSVVSARMTLDAFRRALLDAERTMT